MIADYSPQPAANAYPAAEPSPLRRASFCRAMTSRKAADHGEFAFGSIDGSRLSAVERPISFVACALSSRGNGQASRVIRLAGHWVLVFPNLSFGGRALLELVQRLIVSAGLGRFIGNLRQ